MRSTVALSLVLGAVACGGSTYFVSSWADPKAEPLQLQGSKVAAVVMIQNESSRRAAEDALASEISARGAVGVPMYSINPSINPSDEDAAQAALKSADIQGVVTMRPVNVDKEVTSTPVVVTGPAYGGYWGGYYGYGWGSAWGPTVVGSSTYTSTIVSVETRVYSLRQNKLVWAGQSKTTDPGNVDEFVHELAGEVAKELKANGLIR